MLRTFQGDYDRHIIGNFCVVHAAAEFVPYAQRFRNPRDGVVEPWNAGLYYKGKEAGISKKRTSLR